MMIPHVDEIARRKLGKSDKWEIFKAEWIGDHLLCEGGIPWEVIRGPNKGKKRWDKIEIDKVIVSKDEIESEHERYEIESGNCWRCLGLKTVATGWSIASGTTFRECPRCHGTGKSQAIISSNSASREASGSGKDELCGHQNSTENP